ncbi:hypothetical protein L1987_67062 [Smallanthus sonchifolius]|uniref:Uncharacterized protein n=1 Tax=Smallanthus sonchifolius TaxID=185202 RepID=A0ACB9BZ36_9ASTR|nr:hypothetical protein L1987_67062 [Smallanthus sonchifolius]
MSSSISLALLFLTIATATAAAKEYQVGNAVGWRIPATNETELYTIWASRRPFHIGDFLRFRYSTGSVVLVDKWGFYHCDSSHPISYFNDGNTLVNLDKVGAVYFISGNMDRCNKGQRMIVNVKNVRRFSPSTADPPYYPYYAISPSPSLVSGSGVSDSGPAVLVFASRIVALAGLGLWLVQF